jgi:Nif-specific regulatory protein
MNQAILTPEEISRLSLERDLYLRLLELGGSQDLKAFLEETLSLIREVTSAERGYLALYPRDSQAEPFFWVARGFSKLELRAVQRSISGGIISAAMATGDTIHLGSALDDPRFQKNQSVTEHAIREVLCAPIGGPPPLGFLYLQGRSSAGPFSEADRRRAETFVRHIAPTVDRLLAQQFNDASRDPTYAWRQKLRVDNLIGQSNSIADLFRQLDSCSRFEITVLLNGPSGIGKTAVARAIHENSLRSSGPFIELNCAAIPENLFESELFGAAQGAHSTATKRSIGKIAAAQKGTLFLDEIGELPLSVQGKLLQFLQSKEYFPLGSVKVEQADVRLIVATNADLSKNVAQKTFREDLFYRINVMPIRVPTLHERKEDIPLLARHFCQLASQHHRVEPLSLSPAAMRALEVMEWPGNIRQLSHFVEAATLRASVEQAKVIEYRHLFPEEIHAEAKAAEELTFQESTRRYQKQLLEDSLKATDWSVAETARRLDLTRTHVYHLIQAFSLKPNVKKK